MDKRMASSAIQLVRTDIISDGCKNQAIHRQSGTILSSFIKNEKTIYCAFKQSFNGRRWDLKGSSDNSHLKLRDNVKLPKKFVTWLSLEVYEAFCALYSDENSTICLFYSLDMKFLNYYKCDLINVKCGDVDQQRKELILGTYSDENDRCYMGSFSLRKVHKPENETSKLKTVTSIQAIQRKIIRIPKRLGTEVNQVVSMFLGESVICLSNNGSIFSCDSSLLDLIWEVSSFTFRIPPIYIYGDSFGSDILVYCTKGNDYVLEYWNIPTELGAIQQGICERTPIELSSPLVTATIETLGGGLSTHIVAIQSNCRVQLWMPQGDALRMESEIYLVGEMEWMAELGLKKVLFTERGKHTENKSENDLILPRITFTTSGNPETPVSILMTIGELYAILAVHSPKQRNLQWQTSLRDVAIREMETRHLLQDDAGEVPYYQAFMNFDKSQKAKDELLEKLKEFDKLLEFTDDVSVDDSIGSESKKFHEESLQQAYEQSRAAYEKDIVEQSAQLSVTAFGDNERREMDQAPTYEDKLLMLLNFWPSRAISSLSDTNGFLKVASSPSVILMQEVKEEAGQQSSVNYLGLVTRKGVFPLHSVRKLAEVVDVAMCAVSSARATMIVVSALQEVYVLTLEDRIANDMPGSKPYGIEIDIAKKAEITCLATADIHVPCLRYASKSDDDAILEALSLAFIGDNFGKVNYILYTRDGVVRMNTIKIFDGTDVQSVIFTGDVNNSALNLELVQDDSTGIWTCRCCPGAAVIFIATNGEVKVMRPCLTNSKGAVCKRSEVFHIYDIHWYMTCTFTSLVPEDNGEKIYVTSACLDPLGLTLYIGFSTGMIRQFVLDGLVRTRRMEAPPDPVKAALGIPTVVIGTTRGPMWTARLHIADIIDIRSYFGESGDESGINTVIYDPDAHNDLESRLVSFFPVLAHEETPGYNTEELFTRAHNSAMVTSSKDFSIVVWKFMIGPVINGLRYLQANACRRFVMSHPPQRGLCFWSHKDKSCNVHVWKVVAIVNGVLTEAISGAKKEVLFNEKSIPNVPGRLLEDENFWVTSSPILPLIPAYVKMIQSKLMTIRSEIEKIDQAASWTQLKQWAREYKELEYIDPQTISTTIIPDQKQVELPDKPLPLYGTLQVYDPTDDKDKNVPIESPPKILPLSAEDETSGFDMSDSIHEFVRDRVVLPMALNVVGEITNDLEYNDVEDSKLFHSAKMAKDAPLLNILVENPTLEKMRYSVNEEGDLERKPSSPFTPASAHSGRILTTEDSMEVPSKYVKEFQMSLQPERSEEKLSLNFSLMTPLPDPDSQPGSRVMTSSEDYMGSVDLNSVDDQQIPIVSFYEEETSKEGRRVVEEDKSGEEPQDSNKSNTHYQYLSASGKPLTEMTEVKVNRGTTLRKQLIEARKRIPQRQPAKTTYVSRPRKIKISSLKKTQGAPGSTPKIQAQTGKLQMELAKQSWNNIYEEKVKGGRGRVVVHAKSFTGRQRPPQSKVSFIGIATSTQKKIEDDEVEVERIENIKEKLIPEIEETSAEAKMFDEQLFADYESDAIISDTVEIPKAMTLDDSQLMTSTDTLDGILSDASVKDGNRNVDATHATISVEKVHDSGVEGEEEDKIEEVDEKQHADLTTHEVVEMDDGVSVETEHSENSHISNNLTDVIEQMKKSFASVKRKTEVKRISTAETRASSANSHRAATSGSLPSGRTTPKTPKRTKSSEGSHTTKKGDLDIAFEKTDTFVDVEGYFDPTAPAYVPPKHSVKVATVSDLYDKMGIEKPNFKEEMASRQQTDEVRRKAAAGPSKEEQKHMEEVAERSKKLADIGVSYQLKTDFMKLALQNEEVRGKMDDIPGIDLGVESIAEDILDEKVLEFSITYDDVLQWGGVLNAISQELLTEGEASDIRQSSIEVSETEGEEGDAVPVDVKQFAGFAAKIEETVKDRTTPASVTTEAHKILNTKATFRVTLSDVGKVYVVLSETISELKLLNSDFLDITSLQQKENVIEVRTIECLDDEDEEHFLISNLHHGTKYSLHFCTERMITVGDTERPIRTTDELLKESELQFETLEKRPVYYEIDWDMLTDDMRKLEVRAASRELQTVGLAKSNKPTIMIPSDKDIIALDKKMNRTELKKWKSFEKWWTHNDSLLLSDPQAYRFRFLLREMLFVLAVKFDSIREECISGGAMDQNTLDKLHEIIIHAISGNLDDVSEGSVASGESQPKKKSPSEALVLLQDDKFLNEVFDVLKDVAEFTLFRSWYCGSLVKVENADHLKTDEKEQLEWDASMKRLEMRSQFLEERLVELEEVREAAKALQTLFKQATTMQLKERDLEYRRGDLSEKEVDSIMGMKKYNEIMRKNKINVSKISGMSLNEICKIDPFICRTVKDFTPDAPPIIALPTIPGTNRKPLRMWSVMSDYEKQLEIEMACSLQGVIREAIMTPIRIPDPEDGRMAKTITSQALAPFRTARWYAFLEWYAGEEAKGVPGKSPPTYARVIFAETFEAPLILNDKKIQSKISKTPVDPNAAPMGKSIEGVEPALVDRSTILRQYEAIMFGSAGGEIRVKFLEECRATIMRSRKLSMMRALNPPGPNRLSKSIMFPPIGIINGPIELPPKRYKLFRSRTNDSWTTREMLTWNPQVTGQPDADDELLRKAEANAAAHRDYIKWLSMESERVKWNREQMIMEDFQAHSRKDYLDKVMIDIQKMPEDEEVRKAARVPQVWESKLSSSTKYEKGSGVNNNDEEQDAIDQIERMKNKVKEDFLEKKRAAQRRRQALEDAERTRIEKAALDKRLADNVQRRKQLRRKLEQLKIDREKGIEEKRLQEEAAAIEAQVEAEKIAAVEKVRIDEQRELENMLNENRLMKEEEHLQRELANRFYEITHMEHEDIRSIMLEAQYRFREYEKAENLKSHLELYKPFEPFAFDRSKLMYPSMHSLSRLEGVEGESQSLDKSITSKASDIDFGYILNTEDDPRVQAGKVIVQKPVLSWVGYERSKELDIPPADALISKDLDVDKRSSEDDMKDSYDFIAPASIMELGAVGLPRGLAIPLSEKPIGNIQALPLKNKGERSPLFMKQLKQLYAKQLSAIGRGTQSGIPGDKKSKSKSKIKSLSKLKMKSEADSFKLDTNDSDFFSFDDNIPYSDDENLHPRPATTGSLFDPERVARLLTPKGDSRRSRDYITRNQKKKHNRSVAEFEDGVMQRSALRRYVDAEAVFGNRYYFDAYPPEKKLQTVHGFLKLQVMEGTQLGELQHDGEDNDVDPLDVEAMMAAKKAEDDLVRAQEAAELMALERKRFNIRPPPRLPRERQWPKGQPDLRQDPHSMPFYRETFGVLGKKQKLEPVVVDSIKHSKNDTNMNGNVTVSSASSIQAGSLSNNLITDAYSHSTLMVEETLEKHLASKNGTMSGEVPNLSLSQEISTKFNHENPAELSLLSLSASHSNWPSIELGSTDKTKHNTERRMRDDKTREPGTPSISATYALDGMEMKGDKAVLSQLPDKIVLPPLAHTTKN